jgi:lysophospholipase L1-like esterase
VTARLSSLEGVLATVSVGDHVLKFGKNYPACTHWEKLEEVSMLRRVISILLPLLVIVAARADSSPTYYLALGDSLAQGVQPSANGNVETNQGYLDDLFAAYRTRIPGLVLTKLGCPGETTNTMLNGGICAYAEGSQLAAAIKFIQTHRVDFVTVDVGGNDIDNCITAAGIDPICFARALSAVRSNLPQIAAALRSAAGPSTTIVGMNYYDPLLAAWTLGPSGQTLAYTSLQGTQALNAILQSSYQSFAIPVADVATAFQINNFTIVPVVNLPLNVFLTFSWTWMGAAPLLGPNVHPNAVGYAVIAGAFANKIRP